MFSKVAMFLGLLLLQSRDGTGQDFFDPTDKIQNLRRLTGALDRFFNEGLCSVFDKPNDKLQFVLTLSLDALNTLK